MKTKRGICEACGRNLNDDPKQLVIKVQVWKSDIYQLQRKLCCVACMETFVAVSLPKLVEAILFSTAI